MRPNINPFALFVVVVMYLIGVFMGYAMKPALVIRCKSADGVTVVQAKELALHGDYVCTIKEPS